MKPKVLILGGSYAGLSCLAALPAKLFDVTLIDRSADFEWLPNIHELLSGYKKPAQLKLLRAEYVNHFGHRFIQDSVASIEPKNKTIATESRRHFQYDYLVIALGGVNNDFNVEGVTQYAHPFKSVDQCARINARLNHLNEQKRPFSTTVVGGGIEGIEALGEILRWMDQHKPPSQLKKIRVIDTGSQLLANSSTLIDRTVKKLSQPYPVTFLHQQRVAAVTAKEVTLSNGDSYDSDLTIWTGGVAPNPVLQTDGINRVDGWIQVDDSLRMKGSETIFALGDCASASAQKSQQPLAKQAYHALSMGKSVAKNLARLRFAKQPKPFKASDKPQIITFGNKTTFITTDSWCISTPIAASAKELVYNLGMGPLRWRSGWQGKFNELQSARESLTNVYWQQVTPWKVLPKLANTRFAF